MTNQILQVKGMHCASCASVITKKLSKLPSIRTVSVNYGNEKVSVDFDEQKTSIKEMNEEIGKLGYEFIPLEGQQNDAHHGTNARENEQNEMRHKVEFTLPVTLIVFMVMMWEIAVRTTYRMPNLPIPMDVLNTLLFTLATIVLFWVGKPYIQGVLRFIRHGVANMDTLIGIGTLTAYIYSASLFLIPPLAPLLRIPSNTYFDVTIVVIGFITLGKYLETSSKKKTGDAIEKLLNLQAKTALILRDGKEVEVSLQEVKRDDVVIVKPGAKIPVDGLVTNGESFIDESMVTGEPMPVQKKAGDHVLSGTINTNGSFTFRATKVGSETLLAQIVRMVEEAQGSKAPIQALVDKISSVFVPVVLIIALLALGTWLTIGSQYLGFSQALSFGLISFVGILVIACPCALGLATPTAIIVGVGKGAREGILIKDAKTLEKLHKVQVVVVDKTGTITKGKPTLVNIQNFSQIKDEEMISIIASLEKKSEHPIAHAIVKYAEEKNIALVHVESFENVQGKGIKGILQGNEYFVGNTKLIHDLQISFEEKRLHEFTAQGKTPVILATKEKVIGFVMVADEVKQESKQAIASLHARGIKVVMLTGDDEKAAKYIADLVGIDEVVAQVLPEDKLKKIQALQRTGKIVAMAGDGVNDAPALAQADVGIAMGSGTDVAIESAGITLLGGDISKLVKAIRLSKMTMRGIKQNLFWAFIYNVVGIPLAAGVLYPIFGWVLNPVFAGFAMAMSSVSVVLNSLRLKMKKL